MGTPFREFALLSRVGKMLLGVGLASLFEKDEAVSTVQDLSGRRR